MAILDKTGHRLQRELMAAFSTSVLPGFGDSLFETHSTAIGRSFVASGGGGREWMVNLVPARPVVSACDAVESKMIIAFFDERSVSAQGAQGALALKSRLTRAELEVMHPCSRDCRQRRSPRAAVP